MAKVFTVRGCIIPIVMFLFIVNDYDGYSDDLSFLDKEVFLFWSHREEPKGTGFGVRFHMSSTEPEPYYNVCNTLPFRAFIGLGICLIAAGSIILVAYRK